MAVATQRPNANGTYTEFGTLTGAPSHWEAVDEVVADDDTTKVATTADTQRDTFTGASPGIAGGSTINSVKVYVRARSNVVGGGLMDIGVRSSTTDNWQVHGAPGGTWTLSSKTWTTDPATGAAWTVSAAENAEFGSRRNGGGANPLEVTQTYKEIDYTAGATFDQKHFRVYDDDGAINAATALAAEDTDYYNINVSTNIRLRIGVRNTGGGASNITRRLEFKENAGAWTQITTGTNNVRLALSSQFADGDATTNRLTLDGSTFAAGQGKESGSDTTQISLSANNQVEDEYCIAFQAAAAGNAYQFRISNAGVALTTYTVTPTINPLAYTQISDIIYYDSSKFTSPTIYFESTLKTSSATYPAHARLYNKTDATAVTSGDVSTTSTTLNRQKSAALTLTTAKEYYIEAGIADGGTVTVRGARLTFEQ